VNVGFYACLILAIIFGISTFLFFILKERGALLISGFNSLPKHERELYDIAKMSKDQRNSMLIWTIIMCLGALLSYFVSQYLAIVAFVVWLIVFFNEVHVDNDKAFGKYKLK
jgi:hypothetical protein